MFGYRGKASQKGDLCVCEGSLTWAKKRLNVNKWGIILTFLLKTITAIVHIWKKNGFQVTNMRTHFELSCIAGNVCDLPVKPSSVCLCWWWHSAVNSSQAVDPFDRSTVTRQIRTWWELRGKCWSPSRRLPVSRVKSNVEGVLGKIWCRKKVG